MSIFFSFRSHLQMFVSWFSQFATNFAIGYVINVRNIFELNSAKTLNIFHFSVTTYSEIVYKVLLLLS